MVRTTTSIEFRWGPPPALVMGADGIPWMRGGQPVTGGRTYRVQGHPSHSLVIDVPAGMRLINLGWVIQSNGTFTIRLEDEESGARLGLDAVVGEEHGRWFPPVTSGPSGASGASGSASRDVGALFDMIVTSAIARQAATP